MTTSNAYLTYSVAAVLAALLSGCGSGSALTTEPGRQTAAAGSATLYFDADSAGGLVLTDQAPTGDVTLTRDSGPLSRSGGNPWREIGTWSGLSPVNELNGLADVPVDLWFVSKDPEEDKERTYDVKVDLYVGGILIGTGISYQRRNPKFENGDRKFWLKHAGGFLRGLARGAVDGRISVRLGTDPDGNPADDYADSLGLTFAFGSADCASSITFPEPGSTLYLNEDSAGALTLEEAAPLNAVPAQRESGPLAHSGGNPWHQLGVLGGKGMNMEDFLITRSALYLAPTNEVLDLDKSYDIRVETFVNGLPAGEGITYAAKPTKGHVMVLVGSFRSGVPEGDISLSISARMGTDGSGNPLPGSGNSAGLTCFFGSADCPSSLTLEAGS